MSGVDNIMQHGLGLIYGSCDHLYFVRIQKKDNFMSQHVKVVLAIVCRAFDCIELLVRVLNNVGVRNMYSLSVPTSIWSMVHVAEGRRRV